MNLPDLRHIFDAAVARSKALNREHLPDEAHRDAGLKAVVEALWKETADRGHYEIHTMFEEILGGAMTLDDLVQAYRSGKGPTRDERAGIRAVVAALRDEMLRRWSGPDDYWIKDHIVFDFNEILGSDAVEAAGGPTREDGREAPVQAKIVPAPAADVCRWRAVQSSMGAFILSGCNKPMDGGEYGVCPSCGKPIAFKEPQR